MDLTWLILIVPPLLIALFIFEKRRQKAQRELLERAEADDLTEEDIEELEAEERELSLRESSRRFLRGAPTRRLSAWWFWTMWKGLISIGLLGWLLYQVGSEAVRDPVVRMVLLGTAALIAAVAALGLLCRRRRDRARFDAVAGAPARPR